MKSFEINQAWGGTEKCLKCPIRNLALFADLQQADFNLLHQPINEFSFEAGESLYTEKGTAKFVYTIRSGMIKLVRYLPNGSYRIIRLLRKGDLAGIETLNGSTYLHHAITLQKTEVCRIPVEEIEALNSNTPHLYKQLTVQWQKSQNDADIWLSELTVGTSKQRIANLLLYLANNSSEEDSFYLPSRDDIGALLAITTETASRIVAEFKRQSLLHTEHQVAQINKPELMLIIKAGN
ncbi:MAG: Crp/Fnr family transcriptional regulator [Methylococcales bacterium]|nr:Crp/Fnr family transcriptional regulator [Methylococcales bacterium]